VVKDEHDNIAARPLLVRLGKKYKKCHGAWRPRTRSGGGAVHGQAVTQTSFRKFVETFNSQDLDAFAENLDADVEIVFGPPARERQAQARAWGDFKPGGVQQRVVLEELPRGRDKVLALTRRPVVLGAPTSSPPRTRWRTCSRSWTAASPAGVVPERSEAEKALGES